MARAVGVAADQPGGGGGGGGVAATRGVAGELHVGVTATRQGLTVPQLGKAREMLAGAAQERTGDRLVLHHGDCIGGDEQLAQAARELGYWIVGHPPLVPRYRAWFLSDELRPLGEYRVRNRVIVDVSDVMLACPAESTMQSRGGTWYTIRYAQTRQVWLRVVGPDGRWIPC